MAALNYNHLRYFWAVAHTGNLTRAAAQLNVSQSSLSVQIRKLEDQIGHRLFSREGKQLVLTEAGRIALDHADAVFAAGDELLGVLGRTATGVARQSIRVGSLATLSRNFQMGFLAPLLQREDVSILLRSGSMAELLRHLDAHRLDVLLTNQAPTRDAGTPWISHQIATQEVTLVGASHLVQRRMPLTKVLGSRPLIVPSSDSGVRVSFDALVARLNVSPTIAAEVDDMAMMRLLARAGFGLAVVPPIVVQDELAARELVQAARLDGVTETFYAVTLKRRFPNPLLGALLADQNGG
ncbi:MAG TPA: LysR family transcriptional regulator [Devosia sp.]|nr:LysR family transcriptional regulator [Devosia sp.]